MKSVFPLKGFSVSLLCTAAEPISITMSSENISCASSILASLESDYEANRSLNDELLSKFFEELQKFENGSSAIKEFTWMFGLGEQERHIVEEKECRKVFLVDFKQCRKFLNLFITQQD